jgi:hypothetical protein
MVGLLRRLTMKAPHFLIAIIAGILLGPIILPSRGLEAAEPLPMEQMVVLVADIEALRRYDQGPELVKSVIGLITTLQNNIQILFVGTDQPSNYLGPIKGNLPEIKALQKDVGDILTSTDHVDSGSLERTILGAHSLLENYRAKPGSTVYVITGDSGDMEFERPYSRGELLGTLYSEKGWVINGLSLPESPSETVEFLEGMSAHTGGWVSELTVSRAFKEITDSILTEGTKGSLNLIADHNLEPRDLMSEMVSVAPGTRETTLILLRENPYGSVRLNNPSGLEVSAGDRTSSSVMEAPNVVIWKLIDPVPGDWMIEARQNDGHIMAWEYSSNSYALVLQSSGPVPLSRTVTMTAFIRAGGDKVVVDSVRMFATISSPDGTSWVHEMVDDGTQGDTSEGDGYFTTLLPPLSTEGNYAVDLELRWTDYDYVISSRWNFEAKPYPSLEIRPVQLHEINIGEKTKVMEVAVHVDGQPYPIEANKLTAHWNSSGNQKAVIEFEPLRVFVDGPAWEYEVYLTAGEESHHSILFNLEIDYAGSPYTFSSMTISLATKAAPEAVKPVAIVYAEPVRIEEDEVFQTLEVPVLLAEPRSEESPDIPTFVWVILLIGVSVVSLIALYRFTHTDPYGYLYNDQQDPIVDFSNVRRNPVVGFLYRNYVHGKDLNIRGLEDVAFHFSKGKVKIRSLKLEQPTIRVDNHPLVGQTSIEHKTWLGTQGKLYNFTTSPI